VNNLCQKNILVGLFKQIECTVGLFYKYKPFLNVFFIVAFFASCTPEKKQVTFWENIAPVIYKNCTSCHRDGEGGGFPLVSYNDVRKKAGTIAIVTQSRAMPPWPADPAYRHFADEKVLSDEEIKMISTWVENGCPIGDSLNIPSPPVFNDKTSQLGKPDLSVGFPSKYFIKGNNKDNFLVIKLPYELPQDTFIRTIEFVAGNKKLLHHMNGNLVVFNPDKKKNVNTGEWYINAEDSFDSHDMHARIGLLHDDNSYPMLIPSAVNYLPGVYSDKYPDGIGGWHLTRKGVIYINTMHYGPSPVDDADSSYFNFFFTSTPPKRPMRELILGTIGVAPVVPELVIEPNTVKTFYTETVINKDISITTIVPHMHLIGKKFTAYAVTPQSDTIPLIRINNWDFRWQYFYKCKTLLKIPAGSKIRAEGVYDNTEQNPNNPFYPPQLIRDRKGSMRTTDEMFQLIFNYLEYKDGDENISLE
jgi:hypothetical protein